MCVSNHPLGGLDGLVILKALLEVRPDVRIVANDVLLALEGLAELFLPVDVYPVPIQKPIFFASMKRWNITKRLYFFQQVKCHVCLYAASLTRAGMQELYASPSAIKHQYFRCMWAQIILRCFMECRSFQKKYRHYCCGWLQGLEHH